MSEKTEVPAPGFRDTAVSDKSIPIGYDHMRYFHNRSSLTIY